MYGRCLWYCRDHCRYDYHALFCSSIRIVMGDLPSALCLQYLIAYGCLQISGRVPVILQQFDTVPSYISHCRHHLLSRQRSYPGVDGLPYMEDIFLSACFYHHIRSRYRWCWWHLFVFAGQYGLFYLCTHPVLLPSGSVVVVRISDAAG